MNAQPDDDLPPMSLKAFYIFLWKRRTTAVGYAGIVLGVLATSSSVFSDVWARRLLLANAVVTACLGHYNAFRMKQEQGK